MHSTPCFIAVTRVYGTYLMGYKETWRVILLTLANTEAGRPEVKMWKYANQHKILAESVTKYSTEDDALKHFRKMANFFLNHKLTCIQTIYMLSILN